MIKSDLDLLKIKLKIEKHKPEQIENEVMKFRRQNGEREISGRILDNLVLLVSLNQKKCNKNEVRADLLNSNRLAKVAEEWVEFRPIWWRRSDKNDALSVLKIDDYLEKVKLAAGQSNCSLTGAYLDVISDLVKEAW